MRIATLFWTGLFAGLFALATSAGYAEEKPARRPVKLMINWDEQGMWRSQLDARRKAGLPIDAEIVRATVEAAVDEHAKSGIDRIAYCAWVRFGSPVPGFETAPFEQSYYTRAAGFETLHEAGSDQLEVLTERCHQRGMEFLVCLRMNDRHGEARHAPFYTAHPEWRLEEYPGGLDFKFEGVRAPIVAFVKEVLARYDIDGIELDYQRWCHVFRPSEAVESALLLTDMTQKIRAELDAASKRRGRKLLLSARVPQTLEECHALGFDVATWIRTGLLDYVCPSDFFFSDFNMKVEDYVKLAQGTDCKVYPSVHPLVVHSYPRNMTAANYRAAARNYYAMGAAGVSAFNFMYNWARWYGGDRGSMDGWPRSLRLLKQLRDPRVLDSRDRHYFFYPLWAPRSPSGATKHDIIKFDRVTTKADSELRFRLAEDLSDPKLNATLQFKVVGSVPGDEFEVHINDTRIDPSAIERIFAPYGQKKDAGRELPQFYLWRMNLRHPPAVHGDNFLRVTLKESGGGGAESEEKLTVQELEVWVTVN